MKRTAFLTPILLLLSTWVTVGAFPAKAETPEKKPIALTDCRNTSVVPCIEQVRVRDEEGRVALARLTGRTGQVEKEFEGPGYPEYSVAGLSFEGTSKNLFIPRIVYSLYLTDPNCVSTGTCSRERDMLALGVQPSWLNRAAVNPRENEIPLANRPSNLLCGSAERREKCYRSNNFNLEIEFIFKIRMPKEFAPIWASGSAKNVTLKDWSASRSAQGDTYTLEATIGTLPREMVLFSDYYSNPLDAINASPYADYPADWPGIWIHSNRDWSLNMLQECRNIPFMSVSTNGIYQEVPVWNPVTESIDLKLYAPHLKVNGELNRGFYELRISEELARCFWKIEVSDKTQARVLISYPDSTEEVVVEATKITLRKGILEVLATNFTFSSPTIRTRVLDSRSPVKESGGSISNPSSTRPSSVGQGIALEPMKKCTRGKSVKSVPQEKKCPKGFKAKK